MECYQNFDSQLLSLHLRKVKTQQAIYQEELKIVRLANSLIVETELETNEMQLIKKLELVKEEKVIFNFTKRISKTKKNLNKFHLLERFNSRYSNTKKTTRNSKRRV